MKILLTAISFLFCINLNLVAADYFLISDSGTSARMIGIGNIEGFGSGADSLFENPATLYKVQNLSASLFRTSFLLNTVDFTSLALAYKTGIGCFAFGTMQTSVGDIKHTGADQYDEYFVQETFEYRNAIYKLGYQATFNEVYFGTVLNYYHNRIYETSGNGINLDVGLLADYKPTAFSISIKNILKPLAVEYSNGARENLPLQVVLGSKTTINDFDIFAQIKLQNIGTDYLKSLGIRYRPYFLHDLFSLSAGFKEFMVISKYFNKFSVGLGLQLGAFNLDFAFEKSDFYMQDNQYYVSVNINL
jgi:hypothetical protein